MAFRLKIVVAFQEQIIQQDLIMYKKQLRDRIRGGGDLRTSDHWLPAAPDLEPLGFKIVPFGKMEIRQNY